MRRTRMFLAILGIATVLWMGSGGIEAQIRRRPALSRAPIATRPLQRRRVAGGVMTQTPETDDSVNTEPGVPVPDVPETDVPEPGQPEETVPNIQQTFTLRSDISPANGPENAQGVVTLSHTEAGILLGQGTITMSGLPAGMYDVWVVFSDPLIEQGAFSQLAARLTVAQDNDPVEAILLLGTLVGREFGILSQIVMTTFSDIGADVGGEPVSGAAGQPGWPGAETAQLAADVQPPVEEPPETLPAIQKRVIGRRTLPVRRSRIR